MAGATHMERLIQIDGVGNGGGGWTDQTQDRPIRAEIS